MKVGFNARLLYTHTLRGWNRYTINLLAELPQLGVELFLYTDRPVHPDHLRRIPQGNYTIRIRENLIYALWEQSWLPGQCASDGVEILHTPFNFGLPFWSRCPRVLTLHDAIDRVYSRGKLTWREKWNPQSIRTELHSWLARTKADQVITVSNHAKHDLIECLGLPPEKINVIYEAADPQFHTPPTIEDRSRVRQTYRLQRPYIFYVGGWERRKNVPFLLRAFAASGLNDVELVLGGGGAELTELSKIAESQGIADRVRFLGWVGDQDLPALYAEALCFVYPSEYEGFGLQLVEAMASGCPTFAAKASCLPEILGDGGALFSLQGVEELASLLRRAAQDADFRSELEQRGRARAAQLSWRRTGEQTLAVYQRALDGIQ